MYEYIPRYLKKKKNNFQLFFFTYLPQEFRLNPVLIFTHCSRELAKLGRIPEISTLIERLVQESLVDEDGVDEIVGASLLVMADSNNQVSPTILVKYCRRKKNL